MYPFLLELSIYGHTLRLPAYGVMLALAFTTAYFFSLKNCETRDEPYVHVERIFILIVLTAMIGARLFHVVFEEPNYYLANPGRVFAVWEGGYTLYGALFFAISAIAIYCYVQKISFLQYTDIAAPSTILGIGIGRVGCFLAGCCWGKPTDAFWGVVFDHPQAFTTLKGIPLHPTQLYEAFGTFLLTIVVYKVFKKNPFTGAATFTGLGGYAILRFIVEIFRGDSYRGFVYKNLVSYSQAFSLVILPAVILCALWAMRRRRA